MTTINRANLIRRRTLLQKWQRLQAQTQILRSQMGFNRVSSIRPLGCQGCAHYHGASYGQTRESRTILVCGFHPYGWDDSEICPDWQEDLGLS